MREGNGRLPATVDSRFNRCEKHRARVKQFPRELNLEDTGNDLVNDSSSSTGKCDPIGVAVPVVEDALFCAETDAITA